MTTSAQEQIQPLDQGLTITPEPTLEAGHPTVLQQITAPSKRPEVILPHPEPVHAHYPNMTKVTVQPLDLELTIIPEPAVETEYATSLQQTRDLSKNPELIFPQPEPDQAQQLTLTQVTVPQLHNLP